MLDAVVITCIARELTDLIGARVSKSAQPSSHLIQLELRRRDGIRTVVSMSCHAQWTRIHALPGEIGNSRRSHFTTILEHHVNGSTLTAVRVPAWERIIELDFAHRDVVNGTVTTTIIAEIMGKHANLIIRAADGMILDAIKRIGPAQSRIRSVYPGVVYKRPPARSGTPPTAWQGTPSTAAGRVTSWLISEIQGMSPLWARELCARSGIDPETTADQLSANQLADLRDHLSTTAEAVITEEFQPTGYRNEDGQLYQAWALPLQSASGREITTCTMNELIAELVTTASYREKLHSRRRSLISTIHSELEHRQQKLKLSQNALKQAEDGDRCRLWGELLTAYAHTLNQGMTEALLPDFHDPDLTHTIPLDPELKPIDNAHLWFNRYRRAQAVIRSRSGEASRLSNEIAELNQLLIQTQQADAEQLNHIQSGLRKGKSIKKRQISQHDGILRLRTPGGQQLLVGRNNRQNDIVTFQQAADHDLWFHARNMPGCHLIMRLPAASVEPQQRCLEYAAGIAAFFSAGQTSTTVPVDYARRRHVRRQPGAGPGQALYEQFKTITVRPVNPESA